ncbi:aminoglycoside phosphotransferase family protein [Azospirillum sp.]|uniref:aminoglycoside phosphotransferase family protein n=1 Tax=Azospirillum sp. TaxID=34012 RepID=UPI002D61A22F|nr:phosphotransferase [Azospirillum sp.]HYD66655.1 phosphotransferase [Azospirillum sp.]
MSQPDTIGRNAQITAFLAHHGLGEAARAPLAGDASARRYERIVRADGTRLILMDTPVPGHDLIPFMAIGGDLADLGLSVPEVVAADAEAGLALLEDFGDGTFSRLLADGEDADALYELATDVLVQLHRRFRPERAAALELPVYDARLFAEQVMLFADVYVPVATGKPLADADRSALQAAWEAVIPDACAGPQSLLLRDYHVDNLMRLPRPGVAAGGLLDFQNAGLGPVAYDLVSLLEDARRDVPAERAERMVARYLAAFPDLDADAFRRSYAVLGAVRHTRIVAVFARLALQERRRGYLIHLPRVWRLLEAQLAKPALAPVRAWFDHHLPPGTRADFVIPEPD